MGAKSRLDELFPPARASNPKRWPSEWLNLHPRFEPRGIPNQIKLNPTLGAVASQPVHDAPAPVERERASKHLRHSQGEDDAGGRGQARQRAFSPHPQRPRRSTSLSTRTALFLRDGSSRIRSCRLPYSALLGTVATSGAYMTGPDNLGLARRRPGLATPLPFLHHCCVTTQPLQGKCTTCSLCSASRATCVTQGLALVIEGQFRSGRRKTGA